MYHAIKVDALVEIERAVAQQQETNMLSARADLMRDFKRRMGRA